MLQSHLLLQSHQSALSLIKLSLMYANSIATFTSLPFPLLALPGMADWMELTFCHFNDMRSLVEAWTRDPGIIHTKVWGGEEM